LSIWFMLGLFAVYLAIHLVIANFYKKAEDKYKESSTLENEKDYKILKFCFRWFPVGYVIFLLFMFYA